MYNNKPEPVDY